MITTKKTKEKKSDYLTRAERFAEAVAETCQRRDWRRYCFNKSTDRSTETQRCWRLISTIGQFAPFFFFCFFFYSLSLSFSFFLSFSLFRLSLTNFSPKLQVFSLPRVSHSSLLEDHHDKNNSKFFCTFFLACVCVCGSIKFESNFHAPVSFIRTIPWKWIESLSHWRINTSQVQISGSCRLIEADVMDLGAISNFMGL